MNPADVANLFRIGTGSRVELIGSNKIQELQYKTDMDMQCHVYVNEEERRELPFDYAMMLNRVLGTPGCYFMDFKAGVDRTQPIHWTAAEIIAGQKELDTRSIPLWYVLSDRDIVKLDLICFDPESRLYVEYSCNYYIKSADRMNLPMTKRQIGDKLLMDVRKYYHAGNLVKMLKRLMSFRLLYGRPVKWFYALFNGPVGALYQAVHQLSILEMLYESKQPLNTDWVQGHFDQTIKAIGRPVVQLNPETVAALKKRLEKAMYRMVAKHPLVDERRRIRQK